MAVSAEELAGDRRDAETILYLVKEANDTINHFHPSRAQHEEWLKARDTSYGAVLDMDRAISESRKTGESPIAYAYIDNVPAKLLYVRDHPGVTGRDATYVISRVYEARALLGTYPEGFERARRMSRG